MVLVLIFLVVQLLCSATGEEECFYFKQQSYRGTKATTINGRTCQAWTAQTPHEHIVTPDNYPNSGLVANYCRNPDNAPAAWCYTMDNDTRWEVCGVPQCQGKHDFLYLIRMHDFLYR